MRLPAFAALLFLTAAPALAAAQGTELVRPEAWKISADRADADTTDLYFVEMPPGWHVTTGPAVILWDPGMTAQGAFRVEMEVYLFDPEGLREGFGLIVGGKGLEGPDQSYLYFLLREGGEYIVKRRQGATTETVIPWTAHPAIASFAGKSEDEATAKNVLAVEVTSEGVRFEANGSELTTIPREESLDGIVGLRVNHRLNVHVSRLDVSPAG